MESFEQKGNMKNYTDGELQVLTRQLIVGRHVHHCQSYVVEALLKADESLITDIVNFYSFENGEDEEVKEIYEWWLVDEWLAERLLWESEPILRAYGCLWWGRGTTGQELCIDDVLQRLAVKRKEELESYERV